LDNLQQALLKFFAQEHFFFYAQLLFHVFRGGHDLQQVGEVLEVGLVKFRFSEKKFDLFEARKNWLLVHHLQKNVAVFKREKNTGVVFERRKCPAPQIKNDFTVANVFFEFCVEIICHFPKFLKRFQGNFHLLAALTQKILGLRTQQVLRLVRESRKVHQVLADRVVLVREKKNAVLLLGQDVVAVHVAPNHVFFLLKNHHLLVVLEKKRKEVLDIFQVFVRTVLAT
jgi:hypothetical protein